MARRLFRKYLPHPERIKQSRCLSLFGKLLHQPNLWHLNRRSVSRAFAIGLFWALIPMPFQMIPAAACAISCRANIAVAMVLVWITNPLTMAPIYYSSFRVGELFLPLEARAVGQGSWQWLWANLSQVWQPLYLGSFVIGVVASASSYVVIGAWWRWHQTRRWRRRAMRHQNKNVPVASPPLLPDL